MYKSLHRFLFATAFVICLVSAAQAQHRYEGYSLTVEACDGGNCNPVQYAQYPASVISVTYINQQGVEVNADLGSLSYCPGSVNPSPIPAHAVQPEPSGRWCFIGPQPLYAISFSSGAVKYKKWFPVDNNTGFYNVKNFGAVGNGVTDDTEAIKNAIAYLAARNGGTLYFPDGDYIVGKTDTNFKGITLPSGVIIQGASDLPSTALSSYAAQKSASRIRLPYLEGRISGRVFRIGEVTQRVTVRNIELKSDSNLNTYGIEAVGKGAAASSQDFLFEGVIFSGFDKGIFAHAIPTIVPPSHVADQYWQFDYIKVHHCRFSHNRFSGIYIDAKNTDWDIDHCLFQMPPKNAGTPAHGLYIYNGGITMVRQTFGGADGEPGGDFIHIAVEVGNMSIVNSQCEHATNSLVYGSVAGAGNWSYPLTLMNNIFGLPVLIQKRHTLVSMGNLYGKENVVLNEDVRVFSLGDRFCYDGYILRCEDGGETVGGDFQGGTIVFRSGQPDDVHAGTGALMLAGRPTKFTGTDIEVTHNRNADKPLLSLTAPTLYNKPLLRLGDPVNFYELRRDDTGFLSFTGTQGGGYRGYRFDAPVELPKFGFDNIPTGTVGNGAMIFCTDCKRNVAPCEKDTSQNPNKGAPAFLVNSVWECK